MALDRTAQSTAASPLYLCHGGTHSFTLEAQAHSAWVNQGVSLKAQPGTTLPLSAAPDIGAFQTFEEAGATWTITCPIKGPTAPVEALQLWGQTEFTSPAYKIDVSLGHHRLEFVDVSGNEQFQVIEYGEETTLQAREISYYTQASMPFSVKWTLNGKDLGPATPDGDGWVTLDKFKTTTQGAHPVTVEVPSLYYEAGYFRKEIPVHALAKTPWNNNATLQVNNKPVTATRQLGVICTRGKRNTLKLLNPDLLLKDSLLTLSSASDLAALGITVPELGIQKPLSGAELPWLIESSPSAGKSGWFELDLACSKLKKDWENITGRMISENLADEVTGVTVRERPISPVGALFFREESAPLTLTFEPWMRGLKVALDEEGAPSGTRYDPPLKRFVEVPDSLTLSWTVTAGNATGAFKLKATCEDTTTTMILDSRVISKLTADAFQSVKINGVALDDLNKPDLVFFRTDTHILELQPKSGGPLPGMKVALIAGDLNPDLGITFNPALGESNTQDIPVSGPVKWTITGGSKSGFFDLQFKFTETDEVFPLPCRLLSKNLNDEAEVEINGAAVPADGNVFFRTLPQTVTLTPKTGSPLAGYPVKLTCVIKTGLDLANVISNPPFGEDKTTHSWAVTGSTKSGTFQLSLAGKGMTTPIALTVSKLLSTNLADEAEVKILDELVPPMGYVFFWERSRMVTLTPKANSPMAGLPVRLTYEANGSEVQDYLWCTPGFDVPQTTYSWSVSGISRIGTFQLRLAAEGLTTPISAACSLISDEMAKNVEPRINGQPFTAQQTLNINESYVLSLFWRNNVPGNIPLLFTIIPIASLIVTPPVDEETYTHSWNIKCTNPMTMALTICGPFTYLPRHLKLPKIIFK